MHHCCSNIDTLSSEFVHHFILTDALPRLANTIQKEQNKNDTYSVEELLRCM